mmetsp:Transcript_8147/g.9324  ORF Transcript_8147/g.9324 Transcript_8147/m.9324 type:complete len:419 (+) Transcript_8147:54-1310(+)
MGKFFEILSSKDNNNNNNDNDDKRFVEAFCICVEPKACSRVVKELSSTLPLEGGLSHLKRVRKRILSSTSSSSSISSMPISTATKLPESNNVTISDSHTDNTTKIPIRPNKRLKSSFVLELLIRIQDSRLNPSSSDLLSSPSSSSLSVEEESIQNHPIVQEFGPLYSVIVPKYDPRSEQEWKEHNSIWPTHYYPLKFDEHKRKQIALSESELDQMKKFIDHSISTQSVLIVDPKHNQKGDDEIHPSIVSISQRERTLQIQQSKKQKQYNQPAFSLLDNNPLATPILLAIQGVSRREREANASIADNSSSIDDTNIDICAIVPGSNINDEEQQLYRQRQYLCTGYDLYCFHEPSIFESMACLHSRVRRLVYFVSKDPTGPPNDGVIWGHGISKHGVHDLPGTNHNYRAFEYRCGTSSGI